MIWLDDAVARPQRLLNVTQRVYKFRLHFARLDRMTPSNGMGEEAIRYVRY